MADTDKAIKYYEDRLKIDKDDLDTDVSEHAELLYHVLNEHTFAISDRDFLKLELEEAEAEQAQHIRATWESEQPTRDLTKEKTTRPRLTEDAIKERISADPNIKKMRRDLLNARTDVDRWDALVKAFTARGFALRDMVPLHLSRMGASSIGSKVREDATERVLAARAQGEIPTTKRGNRVRLNK